MLSLTYGEIMWLFTTKLGRKIVAIVLAVLTVIVIIVIATSKSKGVLSAYNRLSGKPTSSTIQFVKQYTKLNKQLDGNGNVELIQQASSNIDNITTGVDEIADELVDNDSETGGGELETVDEDDKTDNYISLDGDIVINNWLVLHTSPSVSGSLHSEHTSSSIYTGNWSMGEGIGLGNKYMRGMYTDHTVNKPLVNGHPASCGYVNGEGRYWVAIGPSWFNPSLVDSSGNLTVSRDIGATDWFEDGVGKNFDIQVEYKGKTYYIYACCGDAKFHTFKDGLGYCQSSYDAYGDYAGDQYRDGSTIEWCGVKGGSGARLNNDMSFDGLYY